MLDEDQVLVQCRVERLQIVEERVAVQELAEEEVGEGEVGDDAFEDSAAEEPAGCRRNQLIVSSTHSLLSDKRQQCRQVAKDQDDQATQDH